MDGVNNMGMSIATLPPLPIPTPDEESMRYLGGRDKKAEPITGGCVGQPDITCNCYDDGAMDCICEEVDIPQTPVPEPLTKRQKLKGLGLNKASDGLKQSEA